MRTIITLILLIIIFSSYTVKAQSGMRFPELAQRLEAFYANDLIEDIKNQLPQGSNYSIWGWDVGDFSGDGNYDVALSVKIATEKRKIVQVYLFVEIEGYLTQVAQFPFEFFELPLEIGVVIKNNACFVTKKIKQFNWAIKGYRYDNGNIFTLDEFNTQRFDKLTNETYKNYQNLKNTEKFVETKDNKEVFYADYLTVPSYSRGRFIYMGYPSEVYCNYVSYVPKGAYHWSGEVDASFHIKSAYDDEYLYMTFFIIDDIVTVQRDENVSDHIELWFDTNPVLSTGNRLYKIQDEKVVFQKTADRGIYSLKIYPGDFIERKAFIKEVSSTDDLEYYQKSAINKIKVVSSILDKGYVLKLKIPFLFFGFEGVPVDANRFVEFGFTAVLHDIDNEFRPEEETILCSSLFDSSDPSSYGSIVLIPNTKWYGESTNIFIDDLLKSLNELGF